MADLDESRFETVLREDFSDRALDPAFDLAWGDPFSVSGGEAHFSSQAADGWAPSGLMQGAWGADAGQGYGLYSFTGRMEAGQGAGPAMLLWPATNAWPGPEVDLVESADPTRREGYWTTHWKGPDGEDRYEVHPVEADLTEGHEFQLLWQPDRLSYYLDGELLEVETENVPVAHADGGENLVMGVQVSGSARWPQPSGEVELHVDEMSYAVPVGDPQSAPSEEGAPPAGEGDGLAYPDPADWDAVAEVVVAFHAETGVWAGLDAIEDAGFLPPDEGGGGEEAPGAPEGWDAVAAEVTANWLATGQWFA